MARRHRERRGLVVGLLAGRAPTFPEGMRCFIPPLSPDVQKGVRVYGVEGQFVLAVCGKPC